MNDTFEFYMIKPHPDFSTNWDFEWPILLATCDFFVSVEEDATLTSIQYARDGTFQDFYIGIPLRDNPRIANVGEAYDNLALNCSDRNPKNNQNQAIEVVCDVS